MAKEKKIIYRKIKIKHISIYKYIINISIYIRFISSNKNQKKIKKINSISLNIQKNNSTRNIIHRFIIFFFPFITRFFY